MNQPLLFLFSPDPNYPWQACLDPNSNSYYYWNMETNDVQWEPPVGFQFPQSESVSCPDESYPNEEQGLLSTTSSVSYDAGPSEQDVNEADFEKDEEEDEGNDVGPLLPGIVIKKGIKRKLMNCATLGFRYRDNRIHFQHQWIYC